ncbi:MAG: hypothetical protein Q8N88_04750 [Nanoarchaeota archaeon]|nr:hypothetical protein [Nanoarchaeota archaeon]
MKKLTFLFISLNFIFPVISFAQTSLLQDKSGEISILLNDKKAVFVNVSDASVSANLSFKKPKWFIGSSLKFKSTEGISKLLDGYKFKPQFDFGLYGGNILKKSKKESDIQFIYYGLKVRAADFSLLKTDSSNTFQNQNFFGGSIYFGYNRIGALNILKSKDGLASSYLFGVSLDYSALNNLDALKSAQTFTTYNTTSNNSQTTLMSDKRSGYTGDYSTFGAFRFNLDAYLYPQTIGGKIGVGGYIRSQLNGIQPRINAGVGFVIGQKDAPSNVVFGVLYQFNDLFNQLKEENDFLKRGGINIVAGYCF